MECPSKCHGEDEDEKPLCLAKVAVADGDITITVVVDGELYEAGIDPFDELIDRVGDDNGARLAPE